MNSQPQFSVGQNIEKLYQAICEEIYPKIKNQKKVQKSKSKKGRPNYIKLSPIYTLSILGFWNLDGLLIW